MRSELGLKIYKKIGEDGAANELQHAACEMNLAVGRLQLARRMEAAREVVGAVADAKRNLADKYAAVLVCVEVLGLELGLDACGGKLISWAKALGIEVGDEGIKGPPGALGVWPPFMLVGCAQDECGPIGKPGPTEREMSDADAQKVTNEALKSLE